MDYLHNPKHNDRGTVQNILSSTTLSKNIETSESDSGPLVFEPERFETFNGAPRPQTHFRLCENYFQFQKNACFIYIHQN